MRAPGASRLDSVPVVRGYQQGCPGETEREGARRRRVRVSSPRWPAALGPAGFPGRSVATRGRAHSGGSWLPAASTLRAGELGAEGGPTSGVPDGLACRMQTLRAAEKARGVCVCEAPGLSGAPPNGSCCWAGPGAVPPAASPSGAAAPGRFPGAGAPLACASPRPPPWPALRLRPSPPAALLPGPWSALPAPELPGRPLHPCPPGLTGCPTGPPP